MRRQDVINAGERHGNEMADKALTGIADNHLRSDAYIHQLMADARDAISGSADGDVDVTVEGHRDAFIESGMGAFSRRVKQARRLVPA